jgi:hypothetical protein
MCLVLGTCPMDRLVEGGRTPNLLQGVQWVGYRRSGPTFIVAALANCCLVQKVSMPAVVEWISTQSG